MENSEIAIEIERNLRFFQTKLPELAQSYANRYALLRHEQIVGIYDTARDAVMTGQTFYEDRLFSVQKITSEPVNLGFFSHAVHLGPAQ